MLWRGEGQGGGWWTAKEGSAGQARLPRPKPAPVPPLTLPPLLPHTSPSQAEGLAWFQAYLRKLVADRASEAYTALLEGAGQGAAGGAAFVDCLTGLFKDIVSALDANAGLVADTFGQPALLDVALALQEECDVHGARILQRYAQHRGLATLVQQTTMVHASPAKDGSGVAAAPPPAPVDPRQVEAYLEEILVLYQRSEEYNQYVLACMANAVAPDPLGGGRENAFRSGQFNITVRELVSSYINLVSEGRGGGCLERKLGGGGGAGEREKRGGGSVCGEERGLERGQRACVRAAFFLFQITPHPRPLPDPPFSARFALTSAPQIPFTGGVLPGTKRQKGHRHRRMESGQPALLHGGRRLFHRPKVVPAGPGDRQHAVRVHRAGPRQWHAGDPAAGGPRHAVEGKRVKMGWVRRRRCVWMGVRRALSFSARP